jgi:hypothetical protein
MQDIQSRYVLFVRKSSGKIIAAGVAYEYRANYVSEWTRTETYQVKVTGREEAFRWFKSRVAQLSEKVQPELVHSWRSSLPNSLWPDPI